MRSRCLWLGAGAVQAAFTLITLAAAVLVSQSVYLGLVWQVRRSPAHLAVFRPTESQCTVNVCSHFHHLYTLLKDLNIADCQICNASLLRSAQKHWISTAVVSSLMLPCHVLS